MKTTLGISGLVTLWLLAGSWAMAQKTQELQKTDTSAKLWLDLEHCAMCKNLGNKPGLMQALQYDIHKIENGMLMITHVPENLVATFKTAHDEMKTVAKELESGKKLSMCGFCECYGNVISQGAKTEEFDGVAGHVSLLTSDKPEVVKAIHEMADRSIKEFKVLAEHHQHASPPTNGKK